MKKVVSSMAAALLIATPVFGEPYVHNSIASAKSKTVAINIHDGVKGGCWTNIGEVRTYAEDGLTEAGFTVVSHLLADFHLEILVDGYRTNGCVGVLDISLNTQGHIENMDAYARSVVASSGHLWSGYDKLNNVILDRVGEMTKALKHQTESIN